jgi:alpha-1,2-glucosyltransferase
VFYLWKNLYRRFEWMRYAMVPVYVAGAVVLWQHALVPAADDVVWRILFGMSTLMVLVPSPLIEFRYFLIPFLILYTHVQEDADARAGSVAMHLGIVLNMLINGMLIFVFVYRPFASVDGSVGRFMW